MKALEGSLPRTDPIRLKASGKRFFVDPEAKDIRVARAAVISLLKEADPGTVVPIDVADVRLTASCHAALFGPVLKSIVQGEYPGRFVVGLDQAAENEWDVDAALRTFGERSRTKLACVWVTNKETKLVGGVDPQVRLTYQYLVRRWENREEGASARELAVDTGSSIQAASNRLAKVATLGIAHAAERESVPGGGAQYRYVPVL